MKKILIYALCCAILLTLVTGCSNSTSNVETGNPSETTNNAQKDTGDVMATIKQINIATGVTTGSWYPIGAAIAQIYGEHGIKSNAEPGGGVSNVIMVNDGQAEIGMTTANVPSYAKLGKAPFTEAYDNYSAMCYLFNNYIHVIVSEESGVKSIPDLAGRPFSNQAVGTATQMGFGDLLAAYNMSEKDLKIQVGGQAEGADQIKDNIVVGLTATTAAPSGSLTELMMSKPCKLLEFDSDTLAKLQKINPGYQEYIVPAGTYKGQDKDVHGIGTPLILIVSNDLSEEVVYTMTKLLVENIEVLKQSHNTMAGLTVEKMADVTGINMHPGAKKFFDEYLGK